MDDSFDDSTFERILAITRRLASSSDLEEVLGLIINALRDVLRADRASVFQYDAAHHEFFATKAHGLGGDLRLPADLGIIGEAGRAREVINIPDAYADGRFNQAVDRKTGYRTRCILTVPLIDHEEKLIGVAQVLNKYEDAGGVFDVRDVRVAQALADQAAVALRRASLIDAEIAKKKMDADIEVARKIQESALPDALPEIPGYDVAGISEAADQTGGDAFDVLSLGAFDLPGDVLIFMGDATGHGIGPALSVVQVLAMVRMGARMSDSLEAMAGAVNEQVCRDLPVGRFVTSFFGTLDTEAHELGYVSAGQAPLVFVKSSGEVDVRGASTMPLGIDDSMHPDAVEPFRFDVGDRFLLLSDGYYEAADETGEMLGEDGVLAVVRANAGASSRELIDLLRAEASRFTGGKPREDDQTAIVLTRTA